MADRIGVIDKGELVLVEEKAALMKKLGKKQLAVLLASPLERVPESLAAYGLSLADGGRRLVYAYASKETEGIADLLADLAKAGVRFTDLETQESSLEEIFVSLVEGHR